MFGKNKPSQWTVEKKEQITLPEREVHYRITPHSNTCPRNVQICDLFVRITIVERYHCPCHPFSTNLVRNNIIFSRNPQLVSHTMRIHSHLVPFDSIRFLHIKRCGQGAIMVFKHWAFTAPSKREMEQGMPPHKLAKKPKRRYWMIMSELNEEIFHVR